MSKFIIYGLNQRQAIAILADDFETDTDMGRVKFMDSDENIIAWFKLSNIQGFVNMTRLEELAQEVNK